MFIYKTTNTINGKIYIGMHAKDSKRYLGSGVYLSKAIKKYGRENFKREILEDGIDTIERLKEREIFWIQYYDSTNRIIGYNVSSGGGGASGVIISSQTKDKISQNHACVSGSCNPRAGTRLKNEYTEFNGVSYVPRLSAWVSKICFDKHIYDLGVFRTEIEAAMAYNEMALEIYGWKSANMLNDIPQKRINEIWEMEFPDRYKGPKAKLKKEDVADIKEQLKNGVRTKILSEKYSVSTATILNIRKGKTWREVGDL